jgi:quinoprotein relay system zinc metallohydrolase 2
LCLLALIIWPFAASAEPLPMTEIAPGVFVHQGIHEHSHADNLGDIANIGFIIGRDAVAVIDSGGSPALGERLREAVRARTGLPIRYLVNTHGHPDHIFGNAAFRPDGALLVTHTKFQNALLSRADTYRHRIAEDLGAEAARGIDLQPPGRVVAGRDVLDLGGRRLELTAHPTAHTNNDLTVLDVESGTLWAGDLVFIDRIPIIDGSGLGWLSLLEDLANIPARRVVPGHGPPSADWPAALDGQRRYLATLASDIRSIQKQGGTIERALREAGETERGRWLLFDEDHPRNTVTLFAELEWE